MRRSLIRSEKGQSFLEFAIITPLLLLLLLGIFDMGRMFFTYLHLNQISQEAARIGSLGASDDEILQLIDQQNHLDDPTALQIIIDPLENSRNSGGYMRVELTYPIKFFTPGLSQLVSYEVSGETMIRIE